MRETNSLYLTLYLGKEGRGIVNQAKVEGLNLSKEFMEYLKGRVNALSEKRLLESKGLLKPKTLLEWFKLLHRLDANFKGRFNYWVRWVIYEESYDQLLNKISDYLKVFRVNTGLNPELTTMEVRSLILKLVRADETKIPARSSREELERSDSNWLACPDCNETGFLRYSFADRLCCEKCFLKLVKEEDLRLNTVRDSKASGIVNKFFKGEVESE